MKRIQAAGIGALIVQQAKRRMDAGRDSTMVYPDLWDHPKSFRRKGDKPLLDTRQTIYSHLNSIETVNQKQITIKLRSGGPNPKVAQYHQHGFKTKGPNFIPLTVKARRNQTQFKPLMKKRSAILKAQKQAAKSKNKKNSFKGFTTFIAKLKAADALEAAGFVEGETYIMAWKGVTVPQRKIFNLPPEDVEEIKRTIKEALT